MQKRGVDVKSRSVIKVLAAVVVLLVAMFAAFGCGEDGPSAAVEAFMKASKDKDCETAVDLIDLSSLEEMLGATGMSMDDMKAGLVEECKASSEDDEIVDYKIGEETMDGEDKATVEVEATVKSGDEETTETETFHLIKKDGEWKIDIASSAGL